MEPMLVGADLDHLSAAMPFGVPEFSGRLVVSVGSLELPSGSILPDYRVIAGEITRPKLKLRHRTGENKNFLHDLQSHLIICKGANTAVNRLTAQYLPDRLKLGHLTRLASVELQYCGPLK